MGSIGNNNIDSIRRGQTIFSIVKKIGKRPQYYLKVENGASSTEYHIKNAANPDNAYISTNYLGAVEFKNDKEMLKLLKSAIK